MFDGVIFIVVNGGIEMYLDSSRVKLNLLIMEFNFSYIFLIGDF